MTFHVKHSALALCLAVMLGSCTGSRALWDAGVAVSDATIPAQTVIAAAQTFGGAEILAAHYLTDLPICTDARRPLCREPAATPIIKGAAHSGRIARDALKRQLRDACAQEFAQSLECSKGIPIANYDTMVAATNTISQATAAYRSAIGQ